MRYGRSRSAVWSAPTNNRIPDRLPCRAPCARFETRGAATSVDNGLEGGVLLDAAAGNMAVHATPTANRSGEYRIPGSPYCSIRRAPSMDVSRTRSPAQRRLGRSVLDRAGRFRRLRNHAEQRALWHSRHRWRRSPDPHRRARDQVHLQGRIPPHGGRPRRGSLLVRLHRLPAQRVGLADPLDPTSDGVRQTFTNKEHEGRIEVQLLPFDLRFASLTTALGIQIGQQELTAPGDDPGPFSGLWDPNDNNRVAGYIFNEFRLSQWTKAQVAARVEHVRLNGTTPDFPADFMPEASRSSRGAFPSIRSHEYQRRPDPEPAV